LCKIVELWKTAPEANFRHIPLDNTCKDGINRRPTHHSLPKEADCMNKADLIDKIAGTAGITKAHSAAALDAFIDGVTGALKKGDRVTLVGFGTFATSQRRARTGRNPQTGKPIKIAAKRVAKFTAGAELKKSVNRK
jgi:DNA-binding protein HU-beta